jgi:1-acyl-sn-glycerol-3-phosphate acyltransferase
MSVLEHAWLPRTSCDEGCVEAGDVPAVLRSWLRAIRALRRITLTAILLIVLPLLAVPLPRRVGIQRHYCRLVLRSLGIRIVLCSNPVRNLPGVLVVSNHVSWTDVFAIGAVLPGSFVARADLIEWPAIGLAARMMGIIPIERTSLRQLPGVVDAVTDRLDQGRTVVAFPEGTTYCGSHHGRFRPAVFEGAVQSGRPVQPVRLTYRHADGRPSTQTAFLGGDSLWNSLRRTVRTRVTVVEIVVESLQLPGDCRRELAARCETAIRGVRPVPRSLEVGGQR